MDNEECAPERESAVEYAFGKLEREISASKDLLESLEARIIPVLSQGNPVGIPEGNTKESVLGSSSVAVTIRGLAERVGAVNEMIRNISRRVEL